jgi:hypothetical protein
MSLLNSSAESFVQSFLSHLCLSGTGRANPSGKWKKLNYETGFMVDFETHWRQFSNIVCYLTYYFHRR